MRPGDGIRYHGYSNRFDLRFSLRVLVPIGSAGRPVLPRAVHARSHRAVSMPYLLTPTVETRHETKPTVARHRLHSRSEAPDPYAR